MSLVELKNKASTEKSLNIFCKEVRLKASAAGIAVKISPYRSCDDVSTQ